MIRSHRSSSRALALVLLVMLLTCEWGHMSVHPTVWAQLILGNVHPRWPAQCPHGTDGEPEAEPGRDPLAAWDEYLKGRDGKQGGALEHLTQFFHL